MMPNKISGPTDFNHFEDILEMVNHSLMAFILLPYLKKQYRDWSKM
jgi:hypothetical protein